MKTLLHGFESGGQNYMNSSNFKKNPQSSIIYVRNRGMFRNFISIKLQALLPWRTQRKDKTCSFGCKTKHKLMVNAFGIGGLL
jgi:hypothetical protein